MLARRTAAAAAVVVATVALAGCGAGKTAQVQRERQTTTGLNVDLAGGLIQVRNVYVTPTGLGVSDTDAGGDLDLHFHVFNRTNQPEQLIGLSSQNASSVVLLNPDGSPLSPPVTIRGNDSLTVGGPQAGPSGEVRGLTQKKFVGTYIQLTMAFEIAGTIKMTVPITDSEPAPTL